jgi:S-adenosylmethionine-dependent methyltransferase
VPRALYSFRGDAVPDDISDIRAFYESSVEEEDKRLVRHPIERDVTLRLLETYLPPAGRLLEIGAAGGAYTLPLARKGYTITAVELSPSLLAVCRRRVEEAGLAAKVTCIEADVRDLPGVTGTDYDAALVMGPLYHLVEEADREQAVNQVRERLKPGGLVFSAFISRYGIWGDVMRQLPHYVERTGEAHYVLEHGLDRELPRGVVFRAYYARPEEVAPLHERLGFETVALARVEPAGVLADGTYGGLEPSLREGWLDLMVAISRQPSIVGASSHLLNIGRKT